MPVKAILFDFDGVILDSLDVKTRAFYDMYLPYGKDTAEKAARHHLEHGGVSRFEKFRHYHKNFLGQEIDEAKVQELSAEFSDRVFQAVIHSAEVKGIRGFLEANHKKYAMWIITGTPTEEILRIAEATGLSQYFKAIYGSPEKKDYWTKKIIQEEQLHPDEVIFVGDATTDYDAAINNNVRFVLREHMDNLEFFKDKEVERIQDFDGFEQMISRLSAE